MTKNCIGGAVALFVATLGGYSVVRSFAQPLAENTQSFQENRHLHEELPALPWMPRPFPAPPGVEIRCEPVVLGEFRSVQVNIDAFGCNILGDAANEPSIAVDPTNPRRVAIGWRQFDSVESSFRQAGRGYSHDGGHTWSFPGVLQNGVFGSDPVLDYDSHGYLYYLTLRPDFRCDLFSSSDGGITWCGPVFAYGADKPWMAIDRTDGPGKGNIYVAAGDQFSRSVDGGHSFSGFTPDESTYGLGWSNVVVGTNGEVFAGSVSVSYDAQFADSIPTFILHLPGPQLGSIPALLGFRSPNPVGLMGQRWILSFHSSKQHEGQMCALASTVLSSNEDDRTHVFFSRSADGGLTWTDRIRVNNDPIDNGAWHWFGMISVAPNGRIDAVWNDTRNTAQVNLSELFFASSIDGGDTWLGNVPVSPVFDSHIGWPAGQAKIGDYYHMLSDNLGVNIAYAATFNGEQDIYFLRIGPYDCNGNEIPDESDIADGASLDCNANDVPDECEYRGDFNGDRLTGLDDHAAYFACRTDPGAPIGAPCCGLFDIEPDGDADLADFAFVQRAFAVHGP